jgi:acetyl-CoA C-acetyltransferase
MDVYVAGVGMTDFGKSEKPLETLMAEAASSALKDARTDRVDALYTGIMNVEEFVGDSNVAALLADTLGLSGVPSTRVETASSTGAGAFETAYYAVASSHMQNVLVLAGEKMTHLPTAKTTRILSEVIDRSERRYGATMVALAAMVAQKYGEDYGLSHPRLESVLAQVAIKNHDNGSLNPHAQFRNPITLEEYLKSQMISFPLRLYDCAPITDGAAAIILTSRPTSVRVAGIGHATDTSAVSHRTSLTSFKSTREAAQKAYAMAGISPADIQFAEVHDAFTPFEIIGTEDLGFFPRGEGWKALEDGVTRLEGKFPVNPSGGLKSRGHPIGASGLAQLVEIVWQLRGEAGEGRQLAKAEMGLSQSIGGLGNNNFVTLLERADRRRVSSEGWRPRGTSRMRGSRRTSNTPPGEGTGTLESFTILYSTPEGFVSPLALAFVRTRGGDRVMACNPEYRSPKELRMGEWVYLKKKEGLYVFEKPSIWSRARKWIKDYPRAKG